MVEIRANQSELARIIGCSRNSISLAKRADDFPDPDDDGLFDIRDVILWWHRNKEGGLHGTEMETLRLQLKDAEIGLKTGELIRTSDILPDLQRFTARLSDALEAVQRVAGEPIDEFISPVFEEFLGEIAARASA